MTKYHKLGHLNSMNFFLYSLEAQGLKQGLAGLVPSEGHEGKICSRLLFLIYSSSSVPCVSFPLSSFMPVSV
jgi:hypothetical protein